MNDPVLFEHLYTSEDENEDYLDPLTGLYSIGGLRHVLKKAEEKAASDSVLYVIYFNVSDFSLYNQTFDMTGGDRLLKDIARSLRNIFRDSVVARLGSDHFVVVTSSMSLDRDIMKIHNDVKSYGGKSLEIKAGIHEIKLGDDLMDAIDGARLACVSIKNRFDKTYRYYDNSLLQALNTKRYVLNNIDAAIENDWLKVYYQPIVRIRSGQISDYEALCRWDDPVYGMLQPGQFIEVLENSNLIYKLDMFMVEHVCRDMREELDAGGTIVPVSVNLSRQDFNHDYCDIFGFVDDMVEKYNISRDYLHIEITESVLGVNEHVLRTELNKFSDKGYNLWIDDFGSGYSSFSVLKNYHFDVIKIDMNFLKEIDGDKASEKTRTILYSIIKMAKFLGMETVCEGTETEDRLKLLVSLGCEKAQGYYFSRPVPKSQLCNIAFEHENAIDRKYEKQTGMINLIDPPMNTGAYIQSQPMALLEVHKGYVRLLNANNAFMHYFGKNGADPKYVFEKWVNSESIFSANFLHSAEQCRKHRSSQEIDFVLNGEFGVLSFDFIAESENGTNYSLVLRMQNLYSDNSLHTVSLKQAAVRSIFLMFQFAHVFDIDNNKVELIYSDNPDFNVLGSENDIAKSVEKFCDRLVYPEDQKRFLDYYSTFRLRDIYKTKPGSNIINYFRILNRGEYKWTILALVTFEYLDHWYVLSGGLDAEKFTAPDEIREQMKDVVPLERTFYRNQEFDPRGTEVEHELLQGGNPILQRVLDMLGIGIFWKDRDRKFLGANKYFLNYYGFDSINEILGLNDEEIGWHINPAEFKNDEEDLLNRGITINGRIGHCIRRGENRTIMAFKMPINVDGEIKGLIGTFIDITNAIYDIKAAEKGEEISERSEMADESSETDAMDKTLRESIDYYIKEYNDHGSDFGIINIAIDGYDDYIRKYGRDIIDDVNNLIESALIKVKGRNSSIACDKEGRFMVLHQMQSDNDDGVHVIGTKMAEILPEGLSAVVHQDVYSEMSREDRNKLRSK